MWAWIKTVTLASLIFLPHMLIAETKKEVIDKLEKFEQKNISNLDPWDVAHLFGLTKVRRPSEWTSSKLLSLPVPKSDIVLSICGEHGGSPESIDFCRQIGMDYVSCSPFRVPVAKLAAAQLAIKDGIDPSR